MRHFDVLLLDLSNLAARAWHTSGANPYQASTNLSLMVKRAVETTTPVLGAACLDGQTCFRSRLYPDYKLNRPPKPVALVEWLESLRGLQKLDRLPIVVGIDHEAEDVIASLAAQSLKMQAWSEGKPSPLSVLVVSHDSDVFALVGERVTVGHVGASGGIGYYAAPEVQARMGVPPRLVSPYKALAGDASDGVKGVPGIGPQRARKLLGGAVEAGLEGREAVEDACQYMTIPPVKALPGGLDEAREIALKCYDVVRLRHTVPLPRPLRSLVV